MNVKSTIKNVGTALVLTAIAATAGAQFRQIPREEMLKMAKGGQTAIYLQNNKRVQVSYDYLKQDLNHSGQSVEVMVQSGIYNPLDRTLLSCVESASADEYYSENANVHSRCELSSESGVLLKRGEGVIPLKKSALNRLWDKISPYSVFDSYTNR